MSATILYSPFWLLDAKVNMKDYILVGIVLMLLFVIFFYLLILQFHRRRIAHQKEMHDLSSRFEKTLLESQLEIQEQTFKNIGLEIHDNIGQVLSLAKLNLNTLEDKNDDKIELTEQLLTKAIGDLRDLSKSLNTEKISDIGLAAAIKHELGIIEKVSKIKTSITETESDTELSNEKVTIAFRMVQEILNNILKHAKASSIHVELKDTPVETIIRITDDGIGFEPAKITGFNSGIGLKSIQQRCSIINGNCTIESAPGNGTAVIIAIQNKLKEYD